METEYIDIKTKEQALASWDKESVIIRQDDDYVYVYPLLGKGYSYYDFDLRRECNLMGFSDVTQALFWAQSKGYSAIEIK